MTVDLNGSVPQFDRSAPKQMRLRSFKPLVRGALRGFCTVALLFALVIRDFGVSCAFDDEVEA